MHVAPTEPPELRALGRTSLLPERFGCDVMWMARGMKIGVQRKEVKDLRASVLDGRLGKELVQMQSAALPVRLLIVEGTVRFDHDGRLMDTFGQVWTRAQWWGVQWSVQDAGCWVSWTRDLSETIAMVKCFEAWTSKAKHTSLLARGGVPSIWGSRPSAREYATWVLQGVDGVGVEIAGRLFDEYGGMPVRWADGVDEEWLRSVQGIGKVKAARIYRGLNGGSNGDG